MVSLKLGGDVVRENVSCAKWIEANKGCDLPPALDHINSCQKSTEMEKYVEKV